MATQFERFRDTMKRMLMLDQADLDFGIYRIMNQKRTDIERYLDRDLQDYHLSDEAIADNVKDLEKIIK